MPLYNYKVNIGLKKLLIDRLVFILFTLATFVAKFMSICKSFLIATFG